MDIKSYSLATFLGVIPYIYIFSSIGNNFNNIDELVEYFDKYLENLSKKTLNSYLKSVINQ